MRAAVGIICVKQFRNCANHTQYIGTVICDRLVLALAWLLHRDVERSSAKCLGVERLQGNLLLVTLKPSHPPGDSEPVNITASRPLWLHPLQRGAQIRDEVIR